MQRAARERIRTRNQHKRWLALARARGLPIPVLSANLFRKRLRVGGCGNARCWLCHGDKLSQRLTPQGRRAVARFTEAISDLDA
ncbi:MAG TPA: hypothetical protein VIN38_12720 [Thiobacillus sp.]